MNRPSHPTASPPANARDGGDAGEGRRPTWAAARRVRRELAPRATAFDLIGRFAVLTAGLMFAAGLRTTGVDPAAAADALWSRAITLAELIAPAATAIYYAAGPLRTLAARARELVAAERAITRPAQVLDIATGNTAPLTALVSLLILAPALPPVPAAAAALVAIVPLLRMPVIAVAAHHAIKTRANDDIAAAAIDRAARSAAFARQQGNARWN